LAIDRLRWIDVCEKAGEVVSRSNEMRHLHSRALRYYGEGELRTEIMSLAFEAFQDTSLRDEVITNKEAMLSFFCGIWIQFLLTEIAGLSGDDLRSLAVKAFKDIHGRHALH